MSSTAPTVGGALSANGSFPYCDGCSWKSEVDLQSQGLHASMIMASVAFKAIFALLFFALWFCAFFVVRSVFPKHLNKRNGTKLFLPRVTCVTTIATILYTICIAYAEANSRIRASFFIIYPCLVAARLSAEASLAPCVAFFVVNRLTVLYGATYIPPIDINLIKRVTIMIIGLLVIAQVIISIILTTMSFRQQFSTSRHDFYAGISNKLAIASKSIYLILSFVYVPFSIKAYRQTPPASGNHRLITRCVVIASMFYCIWAICALAVHLISSFTESIPQRSTYLISTFTYDLPLFLCQMFLVWGALQRDWYFDDRDLPDHGPAQPYSGLTAPHHGQPESKPAYTGPTPEFIDNMNRWQYSFIQQQNAINNQQMQINQNWN